MKNCTQKLTYFVCSFCLIHTKETKNKNKLFNSNAHEEKFIWKKGNLFDLHTSLNAKSKKKELQKVKSFQIEWVFFMY